MNDKQRAELRKLKDKVAKCQAKRDYRGAAAACEAILEILPDEPRVKLRLGELRQRLGDHEAAAQIYSELVDVFARDGQVARATSVARMLAELRPDDPSAAKKLALLYAKRGLTAPPGVIPPPQAEAAPPSPPAEDEALGDEASSEAPGAALAAPSSDAAPPPGPSAPPPPTAAPLTIPPLPPPTPLPLRPEALAAEPPPAPGAPEGAAQAELGDPESIHILTSPLSQLDALAEASGEPGSYAAPDTEIVARRPIDPLSLSPQELASLDLRGVEGPPAYADLFSATPLFSELAPEELEALLGRIQRRRVEVGEAAVVEGDPGDSIFILVEGEARVLARDHAARLVEVARLDEGDFFGEFGIFSDGRRHATVEAVTPLELLELKHTELMALARRHPRLQSVLTDFYLRRAVEGALNASQIFATLSLIERQALGRLCSLERHAVGSTILRRGEVGGALYLVRRGRFEVTVPGLDDLPHNLSFLAAGDFFGEVSALSDAAVTADVRALEASEVVRFPSPVLRGVCEQHPEILEALQRTADHRTQLTVDHLSRSGLV